MYYLIECKNGNIGIFNNYVAIIAVIDIVSLYIYITLYIYTDVLLPHREPVISVSTIKYFIKKFTNSIMYTYLLKIVLKQTILLQFL